MIHVENLVKRYGTTVALDGISFDIDKGEIIGLLGPNGAGKSTTMNILTGYLSATSGTAVIDSMNLLENPIEVKKKIGYLPEQPPLYGDMTVREYLNFVYELKGCKQPREEHIRDIMGKVRVNEVADRLIRNLSKGYKQRVGIAEALIGNPPVLIFDEPTVGLDPKQIIEIRNLMRTLKKDHTVILSTHILSEAQALCERIIIIDNGQIKANARTEDITRAIDGNNRYKVLIISEKRGETLNYLKTLRGVRSVVVEDQKVEDAYCFHVECELGVDVRKSIFNLCKEKDLMLVGLEKEKLELEEIFVRLVEGKKTVMEKGE